MRNKGGHTLIETLVVLAIISILMALYLPALSKAMRSAEKVASTEGMRQEAIGRMADGANSAGHDRSRFEPSQRDDCRAAYRQNLGPGSGRTGDIYVTEMLYAVRTEAEFRAYWFTLIDTGATAPLEFDNGALLACDDQGNEFRLAPIGNWLNTDSSVPVMWEFLSSNPGESSGGDLGTTVRYMDGHVEYIRYPTAFPACRSVAELSHQFMLQ